MPGPGRLTRRQFLAGAATASVVGSALGGCRDGDDDRADQVRASSTRPTTARLAGDPFTLGVASGDPLADRVVLWTRLAPVPLAGGLAGMPDDRFDVTWQVARDARFNRVVAEGTATAEPANAHAVHVDATRLEPATDYFYRFGLDEWTSPTGRTRTLPEPGAAVDRLGLGVVCCQSFGTGHYAAYRHLRDEDLDLVVHLGDYIYEVPNGIAGREVYPAALPRTLEDYRLRYASYRQDPHLQAAHGRFPFMCMWDDHDVTNNYAGDTEPDPAATPEAVRARRAAAYRAYWEHLPLRLSLPDSPEMTLYRHVDLGDLARLYLLDERQYADEPPCRSQSASDLGNCPERTAERHYLGPEQDRWLAQALDGAGAVSWNLLGNPTVLAGVNLGDEGSPHYLLETWDGYPAARRRLLDRLASPGVANPVVLTGDWHAGMVNDVHLDPEDWASPVVAPELLAPAISSVPFDAPLTANPHIRHQVPANGYLAVELEPERLTATFRVVDDVTRADSGITTNSVWEIRAGTAAAARIG